MTADTRTMTDSNRPTVLIADDDPHIVALLKDLIELEGCTPVAATDGERALEALELGTPDLVILDIMMPKCSGLDVLRRMREQPETRRTPVLILSALRDDRSILEGVRSGCDAYVTKPFDPAEVADLMRRLLNFSPAF